MVVGGVGVSGVIVEDDEGEDWPLMISSMVMREYSSSTGPVGVGGREGRFGVVVPDA